MEITANQLTGQIPPELGEPCQLGQSAPLQQPTVRADTADARQSRQDGVVAPPHQPTDWRNTGRIGQSGQSGSYNAARQSVDGLRTVRTAERSPQRFSEVGAAVLRPNIVNAYAERMAA